MPSNHTSFPLDCLDQRRDQLPIIHLHIIRRKGGGGNTRSKEGLEIACFGTRQPPDVEAFLYLKLEHAAEALLAVSIVGDDERALGAEVDTEAGRLLEPADELRPELSALAAESVKVWLFEPDLCSRSEHSAGLPRRLATGLAPVEEADPTSGALQLPADRQADDARADKKDMR